MTYRLDPAYDDHEEVQFIEDAASGLRGIIALHATRQGAAAGGCRLWAYAREEDAVHDALRLSQGMSYKNALAGLSVGGAKAVILAPRNGFDRGRLFEAFGRHVESFAGRYITAEDVGSTIDDMGFVARATRHVVGRPASGACAGGDPAPWTALGVFRAMEAAADWRWNQTLKGRTVAVQGVGSVGLNLCRLLHERGAALVVSDVSQERAAIAASRFGAVVVDPDRIHAARADVFAPCALGGGLNDRTIGEITAQIVCGAANNQLQYAHHGAQLVERGILYCPDYLVNAGGILNVMAEYAGEPQDQVDARVAGIATRLREVLEGAAASGAPTNRVADDMARRILRRPPVGN